MFRPGTEQMLFAAAAAMLTAATLSAARDPRPSDVREPGPQLVAATRPGAAGCELLPARALKEYVLSARRTPFALGEPYIAARPELDLLIERNFASGLEDEWFEPGASGGAGGGGGAGGKTEAGPRPEGAEEVTGDIKQIIEGLDEDIYEIPVNLAGVYIAGERRYAILRDKDGGRYLHLVEGQSYPRLGISVVRVTRTIVTLEAAGKRFPLKDLLRAVREIKAKALQD